MNCSTGSKELAQKESRFVRMTFKLRNNVRRATILEDLKVLRGDLGSGDPRFKLISPTDINIEPQFRAVSACIRANGNIEQLLAPKDEHKRSAI
jgi:hypothetical protein